MGVVVHDCRGNFIYAHIWRFRHIYQAEHIELLVVCEGLSLGSSLVNLQLALESDSLTTVTTMLRKKTDSSLLGHLYDDAKFLLSQFDGAIVAHVSCHYNDVSHRLAKISLY